jgi:uncharacterized protein (TIGR02117 family)
MFLFSAARSCLTPVALLPLLIAFAGEASAARGWACAPDEKPCRSIFVVHDSWHAAIVLAKDNLSGAALPELADFPDARFIEFSWGDKDYFPDPESGFSLALKAAFWSSGSVLHLVRVDNDVRSFYPNAQIIELRVAPSAFDALVGFLSRSFLRSTSTGRAPASLGLYSYSRFYPSVRKFSLLNTCNTWVAQSLETAGIPVSPSRVITAGQLAEQLDTVKTSP